MLGSRVRGAVFRGLWPRLPEPQWAPRRRRLCAASAGAAAGGAAPPDAIARTTPVVDYASPPAAIDRKRRELSELAPGGLRKAAFFAAAAPLVWLAGAAGSAGLLAKAGKGAPPAALRAPFEVCEEFVEVNGVKLHCVSPGPRRNRGKPLMLFLHGFPELWFSWRYQMQEFADDYDVVAVDQRGYNDSSKPPGIASYRLAQLARDVQALVAALGHERCTLVAHDWGGVVAWTVAGMYGTDLLDRLIVMGLPHLGVGLTNMDWAQMQRSSYILLFQAPALPEAMLTADGAAMMDASFVDGPFALQNPGAMTKEDVDWYKAAVLKPGAATAMLNYYRAFMRTLTLANQEGDGEVWRALRARIDVPTLLLHGEKDPALGMSLLEGVEAAFPEGGLEAKVLLSCSHWVQQDYPLQVNGIMREWEKKVERRRGAAAGGAAAGVAAAGNGGGSGG
ncbi:epoxide hydrolase [Raphidocelis subcapitata]|uniref:Epoxide hydrolase n=1 Tax=Raphidocelis subcapitata TaxID=307507 RepID=A0A2V0NY35_9CHLO|nr:epoxide hydrolase [Raphidocelis subcapitata]|eukprot:GBF91592.1 epoxide hydrolase [Raphidocelis subcapitata]